MSEAQNMQLAPFITLLSVRLGRDFNDEQIEFASDFTTPTLSFSYPGTGKTTAALLGLLIAEMYHKVPGKNIYALSFTRMATLELRLRHEEECKKLGIKSTPTFKTLSALCREILMKHYGKLGFSNIKISESFRVSELHDFLIDAAAENDIPLNPYKVRAVIRAIRSLNSSLIFDRVHVESKMAFKQTGLSYDHFQTLRKAAYDLNKIMECVQLDDIFLYTLELLTRAPEVSAELKQQIKILLVDEFQDMSLLQLRLVSLLSDNVIAIGDIRQQIYAFNGACQQIAEKYREFFPNCREVSLTQSYRCGTKIANYATSLILPNGTGGEDFKGRPGLEGKVETHAVTNVRMLAEEIYKEFTENRNVFPRDVMFIFRNNFSAIPIAEELYKLRVPFRVNNYKPAHQIPVIADLCMIIELIKNPQQLSNLKCLKFLIPEFDKYDAVNEVPIYKIMQKTGENFFDIKYQYKDQQWADDVMHALNSARTLFQEGKPVADLFNAIWPVYKPYLDKIESRMEQPASYYTALVAPLAQAKNYQQFTTDELKKAEFIKENLDRHLGVRCYTMHAAKGTEAQVVHVLDAIDGLIPNKSKLEDMMENECYIDAAREIHNERCLVYVAATRAKEELHIHHPGQISSLFSVYNEFENLDNIYKGYNPDFNDVEVFERFFNGELDEAPQDRNVWEETFID